MKTLYVMPLLLASGLYAASEANALTLDNGRGLNGRGLNGLAFNGLAFNGRGLNGLAFNGTAHESATAGQASIVILKGGERVTLH
jgi:hypothetical protein